MNTYFYHKILVYFLIVQIVYGLLEEKSISVFLNSSMKLPSKIQPIVINATFSKPIIDFDPDKIEIENGFINYYEEINETMYTFEFYPYDTWQFSTFQLEEGAGVTNESIYSNKSNKFFPNSHVFIEDLTLSQMDIPFKLWWKNFELYESYVSRYLLFNARGSANLSIAFSEELNATDDMYIIRFIRSHPTKVRIEKVIDGEVVKYVEEEMFYDKYLTNAYQFWDSSRLGFQLGLNSLEWSDQYIVLNDDDPIPFKYFSFSVEGEGRGYIEDIDYTRNDKQMIVYMEYSTDISKAPIELYVVSTRPFTSLKISYLKVENCFVQSSTEFIRHDRIQLIVVPRGDASSCTISTEKALLNIDGKFFNFSQNALDFDKTFISSYEITIPRLIGYDMMYRLWGTSKNEMIYAVFTLKTYFDNPSASIGFFSSLYNVPLFYRIVMNESTTIEVCYSVYCEAFATVNYTVYEDYKTRLWATCDAFKNGETVIKIGRGETIDEDIILNYTITETITYVHYFSFSILNNNFMTVTDVVSNHIPYPLPTDPPPPVQPNYMTVVFYIAVLISVIFILTMALLGLCVRIAKETNSEIVAPLLSPRECV